MTLVRVATADIDLPLRHRRERFLPAGGFPVCPALAMTRQRRPSTADRLASLAAAPKGVPRETIAKEKAREAARARITAHPDAIIDPQLARAKGLKYLVTRDRAWQVCEGDGGHADSDNAGLDYDCYFPKARDPALAAGDSLQGPLDQPVGAGGGLLRGLYRNVQRLLQVAVFGSSFERFQWWHHYPRSPRRSKCARTMRLPHVRWD
jgi:hypothetical protein